MASRPTKGKITRPIKESAVLEKIHQCVKAGRYRDTRHSIQRGLERNVDLVDIIEVLENGYHEKSKDDFRTDFQSWNYAIRGKTFEGDELRVAIYFEKDLVIIVTVIRL